jgi:crotonobetainyl-CoA:carnitine CoA-transferase CaiB-like acyl-CoA transferase
VSPAAGMGVAALATASGPLSGVRVLDLSTIMSGPMATCILADQGADVIKVEAPGLGDMFRYQGSRRNGVSAMFHMLNRGKRSIVLDLKSPDGLEVFRRLLADADVVIHNFRPGVTAKLGVDYEAARRIKPDVVYVSISGFGEAGPMAGRPAYDNMIQAFAGMAAVQGDPRSPDAAPTLVRTPLVDKLTAWNAAQGVTSALLARALGRGGQEVKVSMLAAAIAFMWPDSAMDAQLIGEDVEITMAPADNYRMYRFKNGYASFTPSDASFLGLCRALGATAGEDPRLHTRLGRFANLDMMAEVERQWAAAVAELDIDEGVALLEAHDVPTGKVLAMRDLPNHPQVVANGIFAVTDHPAAGEIREPRHPISFGGAPPEPIAPAPQLGQQTDEILAEAGFGAEEIARLRASGAVG